MFIQSNLIKIFVIVDVVNTQDKAYLKYFSIQNAINRNIVISDIGSCLSSISVKL